ncbi:MAG: hypothetical protein HY823_03805 [Acidobacteria bacterium]|nr:hypothetical protein [Acidobacteriota bacterium]
MFRQTFCVLTLSAAVLAQGAIHPYTAQNWSEWQAKMQAADDALARKAPVDVLRPALEAPDTFHAERIQVLKRHPQYAEGLERQLGLRLKRVKLFANMGFLYAKSAAEKRDPSLLNQKGGAFACMEQAAVILGTYKEAKGEADPGYQQMDQYVAELRRQVDSVASQLGAAGVAVTPRSKTPVDKGTLTYYQQWWDKLDATEKAIAAKDLGKAQGLLRAAQEHQKGWNSWLVKHSEYEAALARQNGMAAKLMVAAIEAEVGAGAAMTDKGAAEKNINFFGANAGPAQRIGNARRELEAYIKLKGEGDPEVPRLRKAIDAAAAHLEQKGSALKAEQLASRKMPVDVYSGADKAAIKAQMLAHWKQKYPQDKVLGIRFFESNWTRETNWKANATSIYKSDYSWLPAKVVVQSSAEIATLYPIFANKQHQKDNKMVISDDRGGAGYVVSEMLMKNVRF